MSHRSPTGFTLIEVIAAISIAGIALLSGRYLLGQLTDSGDRIRTETADASRRANGERLLTRLLRDAETRPESTDWFRGGERTIEFLGLCEVPAGWSGRCRIKLAIDLRGDSSTVFADLARDERIVLRRQAGPAAFRFFDQDASDTAWLTRWGTSSVLPTAVGLILATDTIVYPVGFSRD